MTASVYRPREIDTDRGSYGEEPVEVFDDRGMRTQPAREINGRSIINIDTGERIGTLADLLIDPESMRVAAITVSSGTRSGLESLLTRERDMEAISADSVQVWGKDVILARHPDRMIGSNAPDREKWINVSDQIRNRYVVSIDGTRVGQVEDVMIDSEGRIVAYELSQVFVEGPLSESKRIPVGATHSLGRDVLIVDMSRF